MEELKRVGIEDKEKRSGTYLYEDDSAVLSESRDENIEIMDIRDALKKYDWLSNYMWQALDPEKDEYTKIARNHYRGGYFMWIKKGAHISLPIQSCMFIKEDNFKQVVHNIVIVDEGAHVDIMTGCLTHANVHTAEHIGMSEFYIKKNAYLNFTMIHDWNDKSLVRPRSAAVVEDGGSFINNYVLLEPVKDIQTAPVTYLKGKDSRATLTSLLQGVGNSKVDVGGTVVLQGEGAQGDIISRAIAKDNSQIFARGLIQGDHPDSKAHLECNGLLLSSSARIHAIPELLATTEGADLSHEAAVGKIAEEEIIYLMSRGLTKQEAEAMIVRGFLDINKLSLPEAFRERVKGLIQQVN
ncbi:MAG: SufD family Fe-S cluster assembly protein [Candidatus Woesearchaeota archaeon]